MATADDFSLPEYFKEIAQATNRAMAASKKALRHAAAGINAEAHIIDLIRKYVPSRYSVSKGFVLTAEGRRSGEIDIIIADTFYNAPLCCERSFSVFAAETVCAAIEVTTSPATRTKGKAKFEIDIAKLADVREMCRERQYSDMAASVIGDTIQMIGRTVILRGSPRCFLITAGKEWKERGSYESNLVRALRSVVKLGKAPWINSALSFTHGMMTIRPNTTYDCQWRQENALLLFLLGLNRGLATFRTGQVDIKRYAPRLQVLDNISGAGE